MSIAPFKCYHQLPFGPVAFATIKLDSAVILWVCLPLQLLGGSCPVTSNFSVIWKKALIFSLLGHFFLNVRLAVMISKIFICQSWDCKSKKHLLFFQSASHSWKFSNVKYPMKKTFHVIYFPFLHDLPHALLHSLGPTFVKLLL